MNDQAAQIPVNGATGSRPGPQCLIIGGGPAGLLASIYLARFRRRAIIIDDGNSRAARIPLIQNCPGFPEPISGEELLARLRAQADRFGVERLTGHLDRLTPVAGGFQTEWQGRSITAPFILLCTGAADRWPELPEMERHLARKSLCFCPVCDGYEASGKKIGVIGDSLHAVEEASFLKDFSKAVTLLSAGVLRDEIRAEADAARVRVLERIGPFDSLPQGYRVNLPDGGQECFDVIYPALGCNVRSELSRQLGAGHDKAGHVIVGPHQQTSVSGIYAAGDVVHSLSQIAVAFGHAANAATAIHNALRGRVMGRPVADSVQAQTA